MNFPSIISGTRLIEAERNRQIVLENFSTENDSRYTQRELVMAALAYACTDGSAEHDANAKEAFWPWGDKWYKPSHDPVRNLVKAGALIAAEIDRLNALPKEEEPAQR
jgi:hypothetical protein